MVTGCQPHFDERTSESSDNEGNHLVEVFWLPFQFVCFRLGTLVAPVLEYHLPWKACSNFPSLSVECPLPQHDLIETNSGPSGKWALVLPLLLCSRRTC